MILVIDEDGFGQKVIDTLRVTNPGFNDWVLDKGSAPFDVLRRDDIELVIVCQPHCHDHVINSSNPKTHPDHAIGWIEMIRHGGIWNKGNDSTGKKLVRSATTKAQLPIMYIHKYSATNRSYYPDTFPDIMWVNYGPLECQQFAKKWFKSCGANEMVYYPWVAQDLSDAFNRCISWVQNGYQQN